MALLPRIMPGINGHGAGFGRVTSTEKVGKPAGERESYDK
jgi:hypothetical protein